MLLSIFEVWDKLPTHAKIVLAIATLIATLIKPTILIIKWIKEKNKPPELLPDSEFAVPFSIKISPRRRKIKWYKEKLNNHNLFFQLNELVKYEIDSNKFIFGSPEKTRIFRQILRIYLGVLSDNVHKFYNGKISLDDLSDKEFAEHFDNFIEETHSQIYKKFKDNLNPYIYDLIIMNEYKGFVHFVEKHKKHFIISIKEMIKHDKRLYDRTNYRKIWEMLSLLRLVLCVALDDYREYYSNFNGDLDKIMAKII